MPKWTKSKYTNKSWDGPGGVYIHTHVDHPGDWLLSSKYDKRIDLVFIALREGEERKPGDRVFAEAERVLTRFYTKRLQELGR